MLESKKSASVTDRQIGRLFAERNSKYSFGIPFGRDPRQKDRDPEFLQTKHHAEETYITALTPEQRAQIEKPRIPHAGDIIDLCPMLYLSYLDIQELERLELGDV